MSRIYLAINYHSEGWTLTPYETADEALQEVKAGNAYGEWKILRELDVAVNEGDD